MDPGLQDSLCTAVICLAEKAQRHRRYICSAFCRSLLSEEAVERPGCVPAGALDMRGT